MFCYHSERQTAAKHVTAKFVI